MAKKTSAPKSKLDKPAKPKVGEKPIRITYDLFDLPTAQHRAGLAALLLQIESMRNRKLNPPAYEFHPDAPRSRVTVTFTEDTTAALFDDLYDATWIEGPPREKPYTKGKGDAKREVPPVRMQDITKTDKKGNTKTVPGYVYMDLTPTLGTLRQYLPPTPEWLRLWRDLIWQVIRDSKKKAPYIKRAEAKAKPAGAAGEEDAEGGIEIEADGKGKADGSTWADLMKHHAAVGRNTFAVGKLSSALLLGAQSENAEGIGFSGRIDQNLLLHFWPITSMVYVPRFVDTEGGTQTGRRNEKDKSRHFCLAVPDVADLPGFLADFPLMLAGLGAQTWSGRPTESLVDLPAEGGLSFVEHLARLVPQTATAAETRSNVSGIDYAHLNQDGNIVRFLSSGRVAYSRDLAEDYRAIVGRAGEKPPYSNPLFRRGLMLALLDETLTHSQWYVPFGKLFAEWDVKFFVPTDAPPKNMSWFWADARKKLQEFIMSAEHEEASPKLSDAHLAKFIERIVKQFLLHKAKKRKNHDPKKKLAELTPEQRKDVYQEKRKVAQDAFYRARARKGGEFIAFFTEEICSFGSYFDSKAAELQPFAEALVDRDRTDAIKTLTLLTLSANA